MRPINANRDILNENNTNRFGLTRLVKRTHPTEKQHDTRKRICFFSYSIYIYIRLFIDHKQKATKCTALFFRAQLAPKTDNNSYVMFQELMCTYLLMRLAIRWPFSLAVMRTNSHNTKQWVGRKRRYLFRYQRRILRHTKRFLFDFI